ncbi:MAG: redoxin domain-containing protein [bacterium]
MERVRFVPGRRDVCWSCLRRIVLGFGLMWVLIRALGLGFPGLLEPVGNLWPGSRTVLAQKNDSGYEDELDKGRDLLRQHKYEEALKSFKRANEMREKKSPECFLAMAVAYHGLEAYKNAIESCDKVIELTDAAQLRVQAYNEKGLALQAQSEVKDQKKLREAETVFRQGLAMDAGLHVLHFNLGVVLLQQSRDPEGIAELQKYLELQPKGANSDTARKMIENPRRSREAYAPDFSVTTSEGEYIALEDLRGKVVVLDFWGTWCPPCVASVPSLRSLHKRYAKDPSLVMIGISSDSDEAKWRAFTAENKMVWPQYLDSQRSVQRAFGVHAFPTYVVIDPEGIVRLRITGMSWERAANLEDEIHKQVKMAAKAAAPN